MLEQAGYIGPGMDRQRKANKQGHAWQAGHILNPWQGQAEKALTGRNMLEQAGYIGPGRDS